MLKLSVPLGEHFRNDMRRIHAKFHEFSMHDKRRYEFMLDFIPWILYTRGMGIKEIWLYERCSSRWGDSNKIKFINLGVAVYLVRISNVYEWTSTNTKTVWFSSSLGISSRDSGDAMP
jgi:hypothetical protein